jgi:hypothetical protein
MGHERNGLLPATGRWRKVVAGIAGADASSALVANLAGETLIAVKGRLHQVERDEGVRAAFGFLVGLALAARGTALNVPEQRVALDQNPTTLEIAKSLRDYVANRDGSAEYREIAQAASIDAITEWVADTSRQGDFFATQGDLFSTQRSGRAVWAGAGSGAGFCELARKFFARFTERYLNYFLDRTASEVLPDIESRNAFSKGLRNHVDTVSHHAFDTVRIAQSFAAGWFNRHAPRGAITERQIGGFLHVAFAKIREELIRQTQAR